MTESNQRTGVLVLKYSLVFKALYFESEKYRKKMVGCAYYVQSKSRFEILYENFMVD